MSSLKRYAIYCGLLAPVVSLGSTTLATVLAPASEFTWQAYALSDLGRPDARTFLLFNGGLITDRHRHVRGDGRRPRASRRLSPPEGPARSGRLAVFRRRADHAVALRRRTDTRWRRPVRRCLHRTGPRARRRLAWMDSDGRGRRDLVRRPGDDRLCRVRCLGVRARPVAADGGVIGLL